MKILFFVDDFAGGAGNVIQILASEFAGRNNEIVIALTRQTKNPRRKLDGIEIINLNAGWQKQSVVKRYICLLKAIKETIAETKPDVVVSFLYGVSSLVGLCIPEEVSFIVSERSNPFVIKPSFFWERLRRHAYHKAAHVVVQFEAFSSFDKGRYLDKIVVIPNPIEVPSGLHERRIAEDGVYRFVTMGNDRPVKGFSYLITAFQSVVEKYPNSVLTIYGNPLKDENKDLIKQLSLTEKVIEAGYVQNIPEALSTQDFYIMPSIQEGFPNSLCEAMALGMPCAASLCHEGIRDLIDENINGITFIPGDSVALQKAMVYLITNPDDAMRFGLEAAKIQKQYNVKTVADQWESIINKSKGKRSVENENL